VYLLAGRRWRDALIVTLVGGVVLAASWVLAPGAWRDFFDVVVVRAGTSVASIFPVPFPIRLAGGVALGRVLTGRTGRLITGLLSSAVILALTAALLLSA
jgi:hypothetical protein